MSTIVTRAGKGSALTHNEVDANFNNLNNDKIEAAQSVTLTNKTLSTGTAITAGTINNATIGASTPSSGAFTTLSASSTVSGTGFSTYLASPPAIGGTAAAAGSFTTLSATGVTTVQAGTVSDPAITTSGDTNTGIFFPAADTIAFTEGGVESGRFTSTGALQLNSNLNFSGTGNRILGDFSNATFANRVMFQTSTVNGNTGVSAIPNGTGTIGQFQAYAQSDPTNASRLTLTADSTNSRCGVIADITGTGTYLPMTFVTGGSERMRIDTSGNVGIGTTSPGQKLDVSGGIRISASANLSPALVSVLSFESPVSRYYVGDGTGYSFAFSKRVSSTTTDLMTLTDAGNLGLGVTPSAWASSSQAFQNQAGSLFTVGNGSLRLFQNAYYNSSAQNVYVNTAAASGYIQTAGSHQWFYAPSGTAGAQATFTQAMTLDASGNLIVGGTSASGILTLGNSSKASTTAISVKTSTGDNSFGTQFGAYGALASGDAYIYAPTSGTSITLMADNATGTIKFASGGNTERVRIDASGYTQFSSNLVMPYQGAPTSKAAAATLTGAELVTGILNTTGTTYTITLPTGTNIEGALTWSANNVCLDWYVINTASGTITIGANGNTTLGSLTIATGTSAQFRIRRTAANTFTVYRL